MKIRFYLICISLCAISTISAQGNRWLNEGDSLLAKGDYFRAGICFERVLFAGNNDGNTYEAVTKKLDCLKKQDKFTEAEKFISGVLFPVFSKEQIIWLSEQRVLCAYLAGQFENTVSLVNMLVIQFPEYKPAELMQVLRVLSYNELEQWSDAEKAWLVWAEGRDSATVKNNPYNRLPRFKSVDKAETLATFIPGAGQFYAGRPVEAVVGILIQAAGVYYGVISFQDRYYLSAWAGAGIFGSFHMGGVRRSMALVKQYNRKKMATFNAQVREEMLGKE